MFYWKNSYIFNRTKIFIKKDRHLRQIIYAEGVPENFDSDSEELLDIDCSDDKDVVSNSSSLSASALPYIDITKEIMELLGPYHNFNQQNITPKDLGYKSIRLYYRKNGHVHLYRLNDVLYSDIKNLEK